MTLAVAQAATAVLVDNDDGTTSISFSSLPAVGSGIVVQYIDTSGGLNDPTIDDNQGNGTSAYLKAVSAIESAAGQIAGLYYLPVIASRSGTYTITIHHASGVSNYTLINVLEISTGGGGITVDKTSSGTVTTGTPLTCSVDTTGSAANQVAVTAMTVDSSDSNNNISTTNNINTGSTQSMLEQNSAVHISGAGDYKVVSSTGTITASYSLPNGHTDAVVVLATFKEVLTQTFEQEGFRFRNDDGSESTATWKANQDVDAQVSVNANFRERVLINVTNDPASKRFTLQYRRSTETAWKDVKGPDNPPNPLPTSYSTSFPLNENPISESSIWICGGSSGVDWQNPRTFGGIAYGANTSSGYDDCIACLDQSAYNIAADQQVTITASKTGGYTPPDSHELQILLRFRITSHNARGYEIIFPFATSAAIQVVVWNGTLGDLTILGGTQTGGGTIADGDSLKAKIVGSTITVYHNDVQVFTVDDSTWTEGMPGMSFFIRPGGTPENWCSKDWAVQQAA